MLSNLHPYLTAGLGGILIGLASWLLWWGLGRIAGISGITSETLSSPTHPDTWRCLEVPTLSTRPLYLLIPAGLLVGFGTVWGSGCTSGHGVCGLGRLSVRSLVAVGVFMATGMLVVTLMRGAA
jgi:uncharacterized membrane protein YedE/YeeE